MAEMFDVYGNLVSNHNLQNKGAWCVHGLKKEILFIQKYGNKIGLMINPQKQNNKYAPDLMDSFGNLGDLKTQNTPFFSASRYGCDPQYTVTFNKKDVIRYNKNYPYIDIYFWVDWIAINYIKNTTQVSVKPMYGVWKLNFQSLLNQIDDSRMHAYIQRKNDSKGNAKESYLIDLRNSVQII